MNLKTKSDFSYTSTNWRKSLGLRNIYELVTKSEWKKLNNYNIFDFYTSTTSIDIERDEAVNSNEL